MDVITYYPFLKSIPNEILASIDLGALYIPAQDEQRQISKLSNELNKNIVVYKKNYHTTGLGLCRCIKPARLKKPELQRVKNLEQHLRTDLAVVVYEKPLILL